MLRSFARFVVFLLILCILGENLPASGGFPGPTKTLFGPCSAAFGAQALELRLAAADWLGRHTQENIYARGRVYRLYQRLRNAWEQKRDAFIAKMDDTYPGPTPHAKPAIETGGAGRSRRIEGAIWMEDNGNVGGGRRIPESSDVERVRSAVYQPIEEIAKEDHSDEVERFAAFMAHMKEIIDPAIAVFAQTPFISEGEKEAVIRKLGGHLVALLEEYELDWREYPPGSANDLSFKAAVRAEILLMQHLDTKRAFEAALLNRLRETKKNPRPDYPRYAGRDEWENQFLYLTDQVECLRLRGYSEEAIQSVRAAIQDRITRLASGVRRYVHQYGLITEWEVAQEGLENLENIVWRRMPATHEATPRACRRPFDDFTVISIDTMAERLAAEHAREFAEASQPKGSPRPGRIDPLPSRPPPSPPPAPVDWRPHRQALSVEQRLAMQLDIVLSQVTHALLDVELQVQQSVESRKPLSADQLDALERELRHRTEEAIAEYSETARLEGKTSKSAVKNMRKLVDNMVHQTRQSAAIALMETPQVRDPRTQIMAEISLRHGRRSERDLVYFDTKGGVRYLTYDFLYLLKHFSLAPLLLVYGRAGTLPYLASVSEHLKNLGRREGLIDEVRADAGQFLDMANEIIRWIQVEAAESKVELKRVVSSTAETERLLAELLELRDGAAALLVPGGNTAENLIAYMALYSRVVAFVERFEKEKSLSAPWTVLPEDALAEIYRDLKLARVQDGRQWLGPAIRDLPGNQFTRLVFAVVPGRTPGSPPAEVVTVGGDFISWMEDEAVRHDAIERGEVATGERWNQLHAGAALVSALIYRLGGATKVLIMDEKAGEVADAEDRWREFLSQNGIDSDDVIKVDRDTRETAPPEGAAAEAVQEAQEGPLPAVEMDDVIAKFTEAATRLLEGETIVTLLSDYDDTVEKARQKMSTNLQTVAGHLRAGHRLGILTGGSFDRIEKTFFKPLLAALREDERWMLRNLLIGPDNGSQIYRYSAETSRLQCVFSVDIREEVGPARYPEILKILQRIMLDRGHREMLAKVMGPKYAFTDEQWAEFWPTCIDERTAEGGKVAQITFFALGKNASDEDKETFNERGGTHIREEYQDYIVSQLNMAKIALAAKVSGKSSIDITLPNIDKAFGVALMAILFGVRLKKLIFTGDLFKPGQNDETALKIVRLLGNVGAKIDILKSRYYKPGTQMFQLRNTGAVGFQRLVAALHQAA